MIAKNISEDRCEVGVRGPELPININIILIKPYKIMIQKLLPPRPLVLIVSEAIIDESESVFGDVGVFLILDDNTLLERLQIILVMGHGEWWLAGEHLEHNSPQGPNIRFKVIYSSVKNLRSHVYWCSTISYAEVRRILLNFCKS